MRAVFYDSFRKAPMVKNLPDPVPRPDGVVVRVRATGLCRSDWHGWMGHDSDVQLPHVPGHEFAGEIAAVGQAVKSWRVGDRVTAPFCLGCGTCVQCQAGHQHICDHYEQPGFTYWGSFAEFVLVPHADTNLVRLPEKVDYAQAALLGCRFITAFRAVIDQGRLRPGEWVAVHGCGGVGLSALMIAKAAGAQTIGIDIEQEKLNFARQAGADHVIHGRMEKNVPQAVQDLSAGGAHLSIDALGSAQTCSNSIACLRKQGRHVQVGLLGKLAGPELPVGRIISRELEILGSHGMPAHRFDTLFAMIASGQVDPSRLLGQTISLEEAPAALMAMGQFTGTGVTLIVMD